MYQFTREIDTHMFLRVNRKQLEKLSVGESAIFTEHESTKNAGASVASYAIGAGIRVSTKRCFIVLPSDDKMIKAICVTRLEKELP